MSDLTSGIDMKQFLLDLCNRVPGDEYRTTREWAAFFGVGEDKTKRILQNAKRVGILRSDWVYREAIDGRRLRLPVYAIDMNSE